MARWLLVRAGILELTWLLSAVAPRRAPGVRTRLLGWVDRDEFGVSEDVVVDAWAEVAPKVAPAVGAQPRASRGVAPQRAPEAVSCVADDGGLFGLRRWSARPAWPRLWSG